MNIFVISKSCSQADFHISQYGNLSIITSLTGDRWAAAARLECGVA